MECMGIGCQGSVKVRLTSRIVTRAQGVQNPDEENLNLREASSMMGVASLSPPIWDDPMPRFKGANWIGAFPTPPTEAKAVGGGAAGGRRLELCSLAETI